MLSARSGVFRSVSQSVKDPGDRRERASKCRRQPHGSRDQEAEHENRSENEPIDSRGSQACDTRRGAQHHGGNEGRGQEPPRPPAELRRPETHCHHGKQMVPAAERMQEARG